MSSNILYNNSSGQIKKYLILKKAIINNKTPIKSLPNLNDDILHQAINNTKFNETLDTSSRDNKDFLMETDSDIHWNNGKNFIKISRLNGDDIKRNLNLNSKLSIGKMEYQLPNKYENRNNAQYNEKKYKNNSQTTFFKKNFINNGKNSLKWNNNISYKEIKYGNMLETPMVKTEPYILKKPKYQKYKSILTEININNNTLTDSKTSTLLKSIKNNIDKIEKNIFSKKLYKNSKIKNILFSSVKKNNGKDNNSSTSLNNTNSTNEFNDLRNKHLFKFKIIKDNNDTKNKSSLYQYYKNFVKKPKIGYKLRLKDIQSINLKNRLVNQEDYIKYICKIQSVWRGVVVRQLISHYKNLKKFKKIFNSAMANDIKNIYVDLLNSSENNSIANLKNTFNKKDKVRYNNNFTQSYKEFSDLNKKNKNYRYNDNDNEINYSDYLNHFKSNLNIANIEQINIKKINQRIMTEYQVSNNNLSLINNRPKFKKICHNESINISENKKIKKKTLELKEESQSNLNMEIKGSKFNKLNLSKNLIINKSNNLNILYKKNEKNGKNGKNGKNFIFVKLKNIENFNIKGKSKIYSDKATETELPNLNTDVNKLNYNKCNEIDKKDGLEINPVEIKRTKNNINNRFISNENKIEILNSKESIMTEKAKINMMKIILPIRIKTIFKEWVKNNGFTILINKLKQIAFASHMSAIGAKSENKFKKDFMDKLRYLNALFYKNYYFNQTAKIKIIKLVRRYYIYKMNKSFNELRSL